MSGFDRGQLPYVRAVAAFYLLFGVLCAVSAVKDISDVVWDLTHTGYAHLLPLVEDLVLPRLAHPSALQSAALWVVHLPRLPFVLVFCAYAVRTGIERWTAAGLVPHDGTKNGS